MSDLNDHFYEDGTDDVLAVYVNNLLASTLRSEYKNSEILSATKTLLDADKPIQRLDCDGANRIVNMPTADTTENHPYLIVNSTSSGSYTLTVQSNDASTTYVSLVPGKAALMLPDGNGGYLHIPEYKRDAGYWADMGGKLTWNSNTGYQVEPGVADVNGYLLTWTSAIARSSLTLSADTLYNVYLYSNSGTAAIEESTTAPVWDSTMNHWKKTGDDTRRWIGYLSTDASGNIRKFVHILCGGRVSEIILVDGSVTGKSVVNGGSTTGSWASFSLSPLVPVPGTHYYGVAKLVGTAANDDATIGISPIDLSSAAGNLAPFVVRADNDVAGSSTFFGTTMLPISTAQTNYYRITHVVGTGSVLSLQVHGSRFMR